MGRAINNERLERMMEKQNRDAESRRRLRMLAQSVMTVLQIPAEQIALVPVLTGRSHCRTNEEAVRVWITNRLQGAAPPTSTKTPGPCLTIEVFETLDFDGLVASLQAHLWERLPYVL